MIKINLLSPFDKESLKWEKMNNLVRKEIVRIIVVEILFVAAFFFVAGYLKTQQELVEAQLSAMHAREDVKEMDKMESDLDSFKEKIDNIYSIQKNHPEWTSLFEDIAGIVPSGVKLESVSVSDAADKNKNTGKKNQKDSVLQDDKLKVEIAGRAVARQDLLNFESNLKKSPLLSNFQYDDANYVESANIDFHYILYVSRGELVR